MIAHPFRTFTNRRRIIARSPITVCAYLPLNVSYLIFGDATLR
jgi:hypothetical protein